MGETKAHKEIWLGWPIQGYFFFHLYIFYIQGQYWPIQGWYYLWPLNGILVSKLVTLCLWPNVKIPAEKGRRENLWQKLRPNNPRFTTSSPTDPCSSLQKENFSNSPLGLAGSMWLPSCSQRPVENLKLQSNLDVAVLRNVDFLSEKPVHVNRRTAKKQKIMIVVKRKSRQLDYT